MATVTVENEVRTLTQQRIAALENVEGVKLTYLRNLATATIKELGGEPRTNNANQRKPLSKDEREKQLVALTAVHERFYAIVNEVVDKSLGEVPAKDRAQEKNRRSNFARTAVYTLRRFIQAGKDLTAQAPARINKYAVFKVTLHARPSSPRRLKGKVERISKSFMAALLELSESDKTAAAAELDVLIGQMAAQLATLGRPAVRDAQQAAEEHRPFRSGSTLFVPTQTAVLRQQERPS
jgi:hypothetical protein